MAGNDGLWYSKFHRFIETNDSLTVLSAAEGGIELGQGKKYGFFGKHYKSISIFAESVTLCDPDPVNGIVFGSNTADTVTLSTTQLDSISKDSQPAVISSRGADGKPNDAGGTDGRGGTHGKPGHTFNLFVGQSPSSLPKVHIDARGGHGEETKETGQAPGKGGKGGHARALVLPTWLPIIRDIKKVIQSLGGLDSDDEDSDDEDSQPDQTDVNKKVPESVVGSIVGIVRDICRLCQEDDPLSQAILRKLNPMCEEDAEPLWLETVKTLKGIRQELTTALDNQSRSVRDSVRAPGGSGGSATHKLGERWGRGEDGVDGIVSWNVWRKKSPVGPLKFAPLHPVQCMMQLEKAAAYFYFGDPDSLFSAQRILARLHTKMQAVLDLAEDGSPAVKNLSVKAQEARENRLRSLKEVYHEQRNLIGIPWDMPDPVGELRRIGREAGAMLFQLGNTSVDYYGHQDNWTPRQSVEMFQEETKDSVRILKESETLFLDLARRQENVETEERLLTDSLAKYSAGFQYIANERRALVDELDRLNRSIQSQAFKAEIERRRQTLIYELEIFNRLTDKAFRIGIKRVYESLGNVAKEIKVTDLTKLEKEAKPKPKDPTKPEDPSKPKDPTKPKDPKDPSTPIRPTRPAPAPPTQPPAIQPTRPAPDPPTDATTEVITMTEDAAKPDKEPKPDDKEKPGDKDEDEKEKPKPPEEKEYVFKSNFLGLGKGIWNKAGGELTDMIFDGVTSIPKTDGTRVDKALITRQVRKIMGDLAKVADAWNAEITKKAETGEIEINEEQDKLLVASETQIEKFIEDFVGIDNLSEQAQKTKKALKAYSNLLADRNHDRVQYNIVLKAIVTLDLAASKLEDSNEKLKQEGYRAKDKNQLDQMTRLVEDIYSWNRARTMRLISDYDRAIYLQTLDPAKEIEAGGRTSDAAISLTAAKLENLYSTRHHELFEKHGQAGSDPSSFPMDRTNGHGKYFELTPEQVRILKDEGQIRIQLHAPGHGEALQDFDRVADVRIDTVHFWIDGIKINRNAKVPPKGPLVRVGLAHEGDSIYYHPRGDARAFAHDRLQPSWSYRLLPGADQQGQIEIVNSGNIVSGKGYAAPSPFASWTISIKGLEDEEKALDLSGITAARFEFLGTNREFW